MSIVEIFPSREEIERKKILALIRNKLSEFAFSSAMIDEVTERMSLFIDYMNQHFNLSNDLERFSIDQCLILKNTIHEFTSAIIFERLMKEIEIYKLKYPVE